VKAATPVVRALERAMPALAPALPRVPAVLSSGQELISEAIPAVRAVAASNLGPTLSEARQVLGDLPIQQLDVAIGRAVSLLEDASAQRLPERAAEAADLLEKVLAVQHHVVTLQETSVKVQRRSLEIQRRTLSHTRSIDNRLGGQLPLPPLSRRRP
jgi:hypothetical protein